MFVVYVEGGSYSAENADNRESVHVVQQVDAKEYEKC